MKRILLGVCAAALISCGSSQSDKAANDPVKLVSGQVDQSVVPQTMNLPELSGDYVWTVDLEKSRVWFEAVEQGRTFPGEFGRFDLAVKLDPENPETGRVEALIDLTSVDAGSKERNQVLPTKDWFNVKEFAQAHFISRNIMRKDDGGFEAKGELFLKGIRKEIVLPFSLDHDESTAHAKGKVSFNRTDFNVGEGSYTGDEFVDYNVTVFVDIYAAR